MTNAAEVFVRRLGGAALVTWSSPPVNAFGARLRGELARALTALLIDPEVSCLILQGEGRGFSAGADIHEPGSRGDSPSLGDLTQLVARSDKPSVAVMHGFALGDGLALALACSHRVVTSTTRLALPEIRFGLIPGGGSTQRLARMVGTDTALEIMLTGRDVLPPEALGVGLVDAVVNGDNAVEQALDVVRRPRRHSSRDEAPRHSAPLGASSKSGQSFARATLLKLMAETAGTSLDIGIALEQEAVAACLASSEHEGLLHISEAERRAVRFAAGAETAAKIEHVGVIGAGTMGCGIALAMLSAGLPVTLVERDWAALDKGVSRIRTEIDGMVRRGKISDAVAQEQLRRLRPGIDYANLADSDLVIEAVFEDMAVKKQVMHELDRSCKPATILATNTSFLDVNELARSVRRDSQVIGLHFFSPAHVMKLLEVVLPESVSPRTVSSCLALARRLEKIPVKSGVCDGFIGNRILYVYRQALSYAVEDGASPYQVDAALERFGFAMGPFRTADLTGGDISWATRKRKAGTRPASERYVRIADLICERGWFGQKTGRGYYSYPDGLRKGMEEPEVLALIENERRSRGIRPRAFSDEEIVDRFMCALINEAAKVLGEGIAERPSDIDVVFVHGYGFPRRRGGPLKYADDIGIDRVVRLLNGFASEDPQFWRPAPLLVELSKAGRGFASLN